MNKATEFMIRNRQISANDTAQFNDFVAEFRAASERFWPTKTGDPALDCAGEVNMFADGSAFIWAFSPPRLEMLFLTETQIATIRAATTKAQTLRKLGARRAGSLRPSTSRHDAST